MNRISFSKKTVMKRQIETILPTDDKKRKWFAVMVTAIISGLLTVWGIYGIQEYGIALFILTPIFIGAGSTILYGIKNQITYRKAWQIGFLTLGIYTAGLLIFAIEGLICIVMAAPIGILLTWVGSLIGLALLKDASSKAPSAMLILIGITPNLPINTWFNVVVIPGCSF